MRRHIAFLRRGSVVRLDAVSPTLTLLDYLRLDERAIGTKEGCAEGDCGACTVVLRRRVGERLVYTPVNACIVLAGQADGSEVICVDDLAADGLHPVQQAMVDLHGSQCGFCTPGFVMALFALFHDPARAAVTRATVNDWIAGNLCRCTGYRPIVDAALAACAGARQRPLHRRGAADRPRCWPASTTRPTSWSARPSASSPRRRASRPWRRSTRSTPTRCSSPARPTSGCGSPSSCGICRKSSGSGGSRASTRIDDGAREVTFGATATHAAALPYLAAIDPDLGELHAPVRQQAGRATSARSAATSPTARRSATPRRP